MSNVPMRRPGSTQLEPQRHLQLTCAKESITCATERESDILAPACAQQALELNHDKACALKIAGSDKRASSRQRWQRP